MVVAGVVVVGALALFVSGTAVLVRRHHRQQTRQGGEGWKKGDVIGLVALVTSLPLAVASLLLALRAPAASEATDRQPPSPSPSDEVGSAEIARLHEAADVSLFTEVLGEPGYRRPIDAPADLETSTEWAWAESDRYMVRAVVDASEQVAAFSVTSLSTDFRPEIAYLSELAGEPLRLSETTFADLEDAFEGQLSADSVGGFPPAFNCRWLYSEAFFVPNPLYRRFVVMHGFTGAGHVDGPAPQAVFDQLGLCDPCSAQAIAVSPLREIRDQWPVTSVTVLGDGASPDGAAEVLTYEPTDDDVAAADRG